MVVELCSLDTSKGWLFDLTEPIPNTVDITVKKFDKHMVIADYRVLLSSGKESMQTLIKRIPEIRKQIEI
jgi:hypothetical protein